MKKIIYFDNAATTFPKPECVYKFMDSFYRNYGVNIGRGQYPLATDAGIIAEETRTMLLNLFNADNKQVIFTHSATESLNVVLRSVVNKDKLNVYISPFEHNAVIRTLHSIKCNYPINIVELAVNKNFHYELDSIKSQFLKNKPNVVIVNHASNVCGLIAPVKDIFDNAKRHEAITLLDTAQTAGLIGIDLSDLMIDYLVFAGHKTLYGPFGIAGIICSKQSNLTPVIFGGTGTESANPEMPKSYPYRIEAGSLNIQAIAGLHAALKWVDSVGVVNLHLKETENYDKLIDVLSKFSNIKIIGNKDREKCIGVVSCTFDDYTSNEVSKILGEHGIAVRSGLHCSPSAHKFLGTFPNGTVRFSVSYFNNDDDFFTLNKVLEFIEENS